MSSSFNISTRSMSLPYGWCINVIPGLGEVDSRLQIPMLSQRCSLQVDRGAIKFVLSGANIMYPSAFRFV